MNTNWRLTALLCVLALSPACASPADGLTTSAEEVLSPALIVLNYGATCNASGQDVFPLPGLSCRTLHAPWGTPAALWKSAYGSRDVTTESWDGYGTDASSVTGFRMDFAIDRAVLLNGEDAFTPRGVDGAPVWAARPFPAGSSNCTSSGTVMAFNGSGDQIALTLTIISVDGGRRPNQCMYTARYPYPLNGGASYSDWLRWLY